METLARLVDQSLLRMSREGRYDLHDLLSQFGAEKLKQSDSEANMRQLHFEWFYAQAEQNERMLASRGALDALTWLVREAANLREALAWGQVNAAEQGRRAARPAGRAGRQLQGQSLLRHAQQRQPLCNFVSDPVCQEAGNAPGESSSSWRCWRRARRFTLRAHARPDGPLPVQPI